MSNFRKLAPEEKVYVIYKNYKPARVIAVEKRGRKHYLLLRWENYSFGTNQPKHEKWVKDTLCTEFKPEGKLSYQEKVNKKLKSAGLPRFSNVKGRTKLAWWQKLIINLQNYLYGIKN